MTAVIAGEISPIVVGHRLLRGHRGLPAAVRPASRAGVDRGAHALAAIRSPTSSRSAATASSTAPSSCGSTGRGRTPSARRERARDWLSRPPPEPGVGEAIYELAELDRLRGAFESAEIGYREAGSWGRLPEPGHALLRLAQGDVGAAATAIRRAQAEAGDDLDRARGCSSQRVEIALAADDVVTARATADRLAAMAAQADAPLLHRDGAASRGRGPPGGRRRRRAR